jgi:formylglycine-generating enzyme required for sulfatase activity
VNGQDLAAVLGGWGACRPIITSISPNQGHVNGGALITISGHYLSGTTSVTIGGAPATSLTVVSASTVRVVTPPGILGAKDVSLTTSAGSVSISGGFTYVDVVVPSWGTVLQIEPDPNVVIDPLLRTAIVATGYAWRVRDVATQIEMVLIPPGTFQMGCSASSTFGCFGDESPVHDVILTGAFYLGRYEVTQAQWVARMGSNPSWFGGSQSSERPVEQVSWNAIQGFLSATGMRLPTEAEWEYAYRAGTTTAYHGFLGAPTGTSDTTTLGSIGWYSGNSNNQTRAVGGKLPNGYGLFDMSGNVWEWVRDLHGGYSTEPQIDPTGASTGPYRVCRGGSFSFSADHARCSARGIGEPYGAANFIGFRVARNP